MKLCVVYNTAPRYREAIFCMIDKEYDCDWYFGHTKTNIKEMDISLLKNTTYYKTYGHKILWKVGVLKLLFRKQYQHFLLLAESRCLSDYLFLFIASYFFPKKKVYLWTHGWYGKETAIEARLKLWMFRHATGIYLYGNYAKQLLQNHGLQEDKLFVIHNSLHFDRQVSIRNKIHSSNIYVSHFKNNYPVIIFIGRLTKAKQLDLLVEAVSLLKEKNEYYNIIFVGDGETRIYLENLVLKRNLKEQVWFWGESYDEQINAELLYNADLCVAPGNVGLTAMHAMVFGCPVISHSDFKWQMPEFEAIKPGVTGDFFERGNVRSLAYTISQWFHNKSLYRNDVRNACINEINMNWNPYYQINILKKHIK